MMRFSENLRGAAISLLWALLLTAGQVSKAQVEGDQINDPIVVPDMETWCSNQAAYTTIGATQDASVSSCSETGASFSIWFRFTASSDMAEITLFTEGDNGTIIKPFISLWDDQGNELACKAYDGNNYITIVNNGLTPGVDYLVSVDNQRYQRYLPELYNGTFKLCINKTPSSDYVAGAEVINNIEDWCSADAAYTTVGCTADGVKGSCAVDGPNFNRWFRFQATEKNALIQLKTGGAHGTMHAPSITLWDANGNEIECATSTKQGVLDIKRTDLVAGNWYYVSVDNKIYARYLKQHYCGTFTVCISSNVGNDFVDGAYLIPDGESWCSADAGLSTKGATADGTRALCLAEGPNFNEWFKFQASSEIVEINLETGGIYGTLQYPHVVLWDANGNEIACVKESGKTSVKIVNNELTVNDWYFISVDNAYYSRHAPDKFSGTYTLCVSSALGNDFWNGATIISNTNSWCSADAALSSHGATPDGEQVSCALNEPMFNRWYKFQAQNTEATFNLKTGANYGDIHYATMALYNANAVELNCATGKLQEHLNISQQDLIPGEWYYLSVDNRYYNRTKPDLFCGTYTLCINCDQMVGPEMMAPICGADEVKINTVIQCTEDARASAYEFLISRTDGTAQTLVSQDNQMMLQELDAAIPNNTAYTISAKCLFNGAESSYGPACDFTTSSLPIVGIDTSYCNTEIAFNSTIKATKDTSASTYLFNISSADGNYSETIASNDRKLRFARLQDTLKYSTSYNVTVQIIVNGDTSQIGDVCQVTTIEHPLTELNTINCNATDLQLNHKLKANKVFGADFYDFKITTANGLNTMVLQSKNRKLNLLKLDSLLSFNQTYTVSIRTIVNSDTSAYGSSCSVTTGSHPVTQLDSASCALDSIAVTQRLKAEKVIGVYSYEFLVRSTDGTFSEVVSRPNRIFRLKQLSRALPLHKDYTIQVRTILGADTSAYGYACTFTTRTGVTTQLVASDCGADSVSFEQVLTIDSIEGATAYEIVLSDDNGILAQSQSTDTEFSLDDLYDSLNYETTYYITIQGNFNGTLEPIGDTCAVTTMTEPIVALVTINGCTIMEENMPADFGVFVGAATTEKEHNKKGSKHDKSLTIIVGYRTDGRPGAWLVQKDCTVQPIKNSGRGHQHSSLLPELPSVDAKNGWKYYITGIAEDATYATGYAEHTEGAVIHYGHCRGQQIAPGTQINTRYILADQGHGHGNKHGHGHGSINKIKIKAMCHLERCGHTVIGCKQITANGDANKLSTELNDFEGDFDKLSQSVSFNWSTEMEIDCDHFEIERSLDLEHFELIDQVGASGNTFDRSEYESTDTKPITGTSFYRLKMVDYNGDVTYTEPVAIQIISEESSIFSVYPNPSNGIINVSLATSDKEITITILSLTGKVLKMYHVQNENELFKHVFNVRGMLSPGYYFLNINTDRGQHVKKILIY